MGSGTTTTWSNLNRQKQQKEQEKLNQMNGKLFIKICIFFITVRKLELLSWSSRFTTCLFSAEEISNFPLNHVAGIP